MITLKRLRILILIAWLIYICQVLTVNLYDTSLHSPVIHMARISLNRAVDVNKIFDISLLIEVTLLIYASAGLWLGYIMGKWAFVIYLVFALADNYFVSVRAFSSIDILLEDLDFLVLGIILLAIFSSPLKEQFAKTKTVPFWQFFFTFFAFFAVFFGILYIVNYLL